MRKIPQQIDKPLSRRQNIFYFVVIVISILIIIFSRYQIFNSLNTVFAFFNQPYNNIFKNIIQITENFQKSMNCTLKKTILKKKISN